ncbi:MAG: LysR family transcriptional regulator [Paracoccaceae bacterium]|nr:LysR family transcriptional regulator [Paracoccaceae bacterium]
MNLRQLRTLVAIGENGSFTAAGQAIGLSHSAVSLHVKALEQELGVSLADRSHRPPRLTAAGTALVEQARRMAALVDEIHALGSDAALAGALAVGVVPTAMIHLLPPALARLRDAHPKLMIQVRTGLSSELAQAVRGGELDAAVVTQPEMPPEGLALHHIADEPLVVIAPPGTQGTDDTALIAAHPFIWFNRKTWAGQHIERLLAARGLRPGKAMEVDSLEAIEAMVAHGLGVSVVPLRPGAALPADLVQLPFGVPQARRGLSLVERDGNPKARLTSALHQQLVAVAGR